MRLPPLETRLVSAQEMAAIDRAAIQGRGIPSLALMERAGRESAKRIAAWWKPARAARAGAGAKGRAGSGARPAVRPGARGVALVLAGRGNNGGDGFVAARHLKAAGFTVRVLVAAEEGALSPDARVTADGCVRARIPVTFLPDPRAWGPGSEAAIAAAGAAFLVDALLGTGAAGAPRGAIAAAIEMASASGQPIVSIDIPSGVDATSGHADVPSIRAELTITLAVSKIGLALEPGRSQAGEVEVVDIGIPPDVVSASVPHMLVADLGWARSLLPRRPLDAHKGSMGRVLVVGGSAGMMGAMAMASEAVLRAGAGYSIAAVPASCVDVLESRVVEVVKRGMPETAARSLGMGAREPILEEAMRADVVAIGPGASRHPETEELLRALVDRIEGPMILDADALNAFEGRELKRRHGPLIVSPHFGEAARLTGGTTADVARDPAGWARGFASRSGAIVCLKATPMIVAAPSEPLLLNASGNPGMATAGAGDVLTGTIAGLLAQGMDAPDAAVLGCVVHGLAGDVAARRQGMRGMTAPDILAALPAALLALESGALDGI